MRDACRQHRQNLPVFCTDENDEREGGTGEGGGGGDDGERERQRQRDRETERQRERGIIDFKVQSTRTVISGCKREKGAGGRGVG